jgi:predicted pyridoxine 5'-phosphate oxidase superfamily flavin-nucleotide-binding protein
VIITKEIKELITKAPTVSIATVSNEGEPHLIIVGKVAEVRDEDILVFGIYKMQVTQQNIHDNGKMQVAIATMDGNPKGYRLSGQASIDEKQVLFKVEKAELLL